MPMKVLANFWLVCTTFGCSHTKQKIKQKSCKLSGQQFKPSSTNWPAWPKTRIWQMPLQLPMAQKLCSLPESNCSWPKRNTSSPCPFRPNPIRNACHLRLERNGSRTNAERENPFGAHTQREREEERGRERVRHVGKFQVWKSLMFRHSHLQNVCAKKRIIRKFLYKICGYFLMGLKREIQERCNILHRAL